MNLSQVILKPILTEKTVKGTPHGKYSFIVNEDATKIDVKIALKTLYGANVVKVNILKGQPKTKLGRGRKLVTKRTETRKAIVTLKKGEKLDLSKPKAKK